MLTVVFAVNIFFYSLRVSEEQAVMKQVVGVGENVTLNCYPPQNQSFLSWELKRTSKPTQDLVGVNVRHLDRGITKSGDFSINYKQYWNISHSALALNFADACLNASKNILLFYNEFWITASAY